MNTRLNISATVSIVPSLATAAFIAHSLIKRRGKTTTSKSEEPSPIKVEDFYSKEMLAFTRAQNESSARLLAGRYDNWSDLQIRNEFNVLYSNYMNE